MNSRTMTLLLTLVLCLGFAATVAAQDILWNQTEGYQNFAMGYFNSVSGAPPMGMTSYTVNDVVVPEGGWNIGAIRTYYQVTDANWGTAISQGYLYIHPKTGSSPTEAAGTGEIIPMIATDIGGWWEITADLGSYELGAGEYWIGITPFAPAGMMGPDIQASVPAVGDDSPSYDPYGFPMPMWMVWNGGLDATLLIEASSTVATENTTLDGLKANYR